MSLKKDQNASVRINARDIFSSRSALARTPRNVVRIVTAPTYINRRNMCVRETRTGIIARRIQDDQVNAFRTR